MSKDRNVKIVKAEQFQVIDKEGRVRAILYSSGFGGDPRCEFFDNAGSGRLSIEVADGRPIIKLMNPDGQPIIIISLREDDTSSIEMSASDGSPRLSMHVDVEGVATVNVGGRNN